MVPGLFLSVSTNVWVRRKSDERATEQLKPENRPGEMELKDLKLGFLDTAVAFVEFAL